jgi:[ribosomal protein S18]-alanine N-acetyltransferase
MTQGEIRIRSFSPEDAAAVALLERRCDPQPWSEASLRTLADPAGGRRGLVAEREGNVLGYVFASLAAGESEILIFGVDPVARRKGVARALLERLLESLRADGAETVHLEVREGNHAARALYRAAGFVEAGLRRGYYSDNGENAVLLRRDC